MLANPDIEVGRARDDDRRSTWARRTSSACACPILNRIECSVADYSLLAKPAWVDVLVERLKDAAEQRTRVLVAGERVRILEVQAESA